MGREQESTRRATVALAFLQAKPHMEKKELADKVTKALDLPEGEKRVERAFKALESTGKISISLDTNSVSLIEP